MSKRLTASRIERWQADAEKAAAILDKIEREVKDYRLAAKGGRLSHLTDTLTACTTIRRGIREALIERLATLHRSETR
jgi:hypothetical protein